MLKGVERDTHQSVFVSYVTGECDDEIHFMFACLLYNDVRESILEPVFKNEVKYQPMSDSHLMKLKHREALNFSEKSLAQETI